MLISMKLGKLMKTLPGFVKLMRIVNSSLETLKVNKFTSAELLQISTLLYLLIM
jgi:hypothetical protein